MTITADAESQTLALGTSQLPDHTAATQLGEWKYDFSRYAQLYDTIFAGQQRRFNSGRLWENCQGYVSDHSADNVAVFNLFRQERDKQVHISLQDSAVEAISEGDLQQLVNSKICRLITNIGFVAWVNLSEESRAVHEGAARAAVVQRLGQDRYDSLPAEQKTRLQRCIRTGCGSHKDQNAFLAFMKAIQARYRANRLLQRPRTLPICTLAGVIAHAAQNADESIFDLATGSAEKLAKLVALYFKNPDDHQGEGDEFVLFMVAKYGTCPPIPNIQQSRFQSNYKMCEFIILFRQDLLDYLTLVGHTKTTHKLNNLELNIQAGLQDPPTLSEVAAAAYYGICIGKPVMARLHSNCTNNALTLGPFYSTVVETCELLAAQPEQCPNTTLSTGITTVERRPHARPGQIQEFATFSAQILQMKNSGMLPELEDVISCGFHGAADGWRHFTAEFQQGGSLHGLPTALESQLSLPPTNDHNEGALGFNRVASRAKPSEGLLARNAQWKWWQNATGKFFAGLRGSQDLAAIRAYARRQARIVAADKPHKKRQNELIVLKRQKQTEYLARKAKQAAQQARLARELDDFEPTRILDLGELNSRGPPRGASLTLHLRWHRTRGQADVQAKIKATQNVPQQVSMLQRLLRFIYEFLDNPTTHGGPDKPFNLAFSQIELLEQTE